MDFMLKTLRRERYAVILILVTKMLRYMETGLLEAV